MTENTELIQQLQLAGRDAHNVAGWIGFYRGIVEWERLGKAHPVSVERCEQAMRRFLAGATVNEAKEWMRNKP